MDFVLCVVDSMTFLESVLRTTGIALDGRLSVRT